MSNHLFSLNQQIPHGTCSIFNQLLIHYQNHQNTLTNNQSELFQIQEYQQQQEEQRNYHKSSGQWVWADQDQFDNQYQKIQCENNFNDTFMSENFQLRRVKSLRIEQEDKITMFLKKDSFNEIQQQQNNQQEEEPQRIFHSPNKRPNLVNKSQSLSPKKFKSKKIDKFKQFRLI